MSLEQVQDEVGLSIGAQQQQPRGEVPRRQRFRGLELRSVVIQHVAMDEVAPAGGFPTIDAFAMTPERASKPKKRVPVLAQEKVDLAEEGLPLGTDS